MRLAALQDLAHGVERRPPDFIAALQVEDRIAAATSLLRAPDRIKSGALVVARSLRESNVRHCVAAGSSGRTAASVALGQVGAFSEDQDPVLGQPTRYRAVRESLQCGGAGPANGSPAAAGAARHLLGAANQRNHFGSQKMTRVLVVGLGNMGLSHALAHHRHQGAEIVGLANRSAVDLPEELQSYPFFSTFEEGLGTKPDLVAIATYADTHADFACAAMEAGAHVFVEKPLAMTVGEAERVVETAARTRRKLVVGYILRHHPSWMRLIEEARALGGPYVFRLNLNQQSSGREWETHKALMQTTSPVVDCGVHYVDVMCQITDSAPVRVQGMGLRLTNEIPEHMYNYGQFQVVFAAGSVGWYEAGWGPMMSETAFFVKDIVSPNGSVSITEGGKGASSDIDGHTKVGGILVHTPRGDRTVDMPREPGHQELCEAEQAYVLRAIAEDIDLTRHLTDAVRSLAICLAADKSIRTGQPVRDVHA